MPKTPPSARTKSSRTTKNADAASPGLVSFIDVQIGLVLDALSELGLEDDTRLIYQK